MKNYRYILAKDGKKVACPGCGKRRAVPFIDSKTSERLPEQYAKCDRESNCTYFVSPYHDGFAKAVWEQENEGKSFHLNKYSAKSHSKPQIQHQSIYYIPRHILEETLRNYEENEFIQGLTQVFTIQDVTTQIEKYFVGTNDRWPGATTFPFIDIKGNVRAVQIKLFDKSLHTVKYEDAGEIKSCTSYLHKVLEYQFKKVSPVLPEWLTDYAKNEKKVSCFFGEHLLSLPENKGRPVAIVEAPKTAVIADMYFRKLIPSNSFIWLAVGALSYLTPERCKVVQGRTVFLFPDLNAFDKWSRRVKELSNVANFTVSDLLERKATEAEKAQGLDLADYILSLQRIKTEHQKPEQTISLKSNGILGVPCEFPTTKEFNNINIVTVEHSTGFYDILFTATGAPVQADQMHDDVNRLCEHYEKKFETILFDNTPCWGHFVNN